MDRGAWRAIVHGVAELDMIEQLRRMCAHTHTQAHACTRTHTHMYTHAHAHTHSHMQTGLTGSLMLPSLILAFCTASI